MESMFKSTFVLWLRDTDYITERNTEERAVRPTIMEERWERIIKLHEKLCPALGEQRLALIIDDGEREKVGSYHFHTRPRSSL